MPDYYLLNRADITADYITARRARELYAEAQADPNANLDGDLETCFCFWSFDTETGLKLIYYTVTPAEADDVPEDVREQLAPDIRVCVEPDAESVKGAPHLR